MEYFSVIKDICVYYERCEELIMMNWFEQILNHEWDVTPAGGLTGDAYFATKDDRRLFLKRNSSPFLAVLSAEGIVPKLIWTKRMENGDVITAQEWLDGRELKPEEMKHPRVANLLKKIHQSSELLHMLMRLGKKPVSPNDRVIKIRSQLKKLDLISWIEVNQALQYLVCLLPDENKTRQAVCHSDLNHNNLLLTKDGQLYLIDWENTMIADPVIDYGMILNAYIPKENWEEWLENYGVEKTDELIQRMYWYLLMDSLQFLAWHFSRNESQRVKERLHALRKLNQKIAGLSSS